jgi:ribosomal protein S18 acetylase RimI-like enzyme
MQPSLLAALPALLEPLRARAPEEADAAFLARLYASTRADLDSATVERAVVAALIAMQQRLQLAGYRQQFPLAHYLLLELNGAAVGRIVVDPGPPQMRLVDIAVAPEWRQQGIASAVLGALQQCAAGQSMPLTLSVHHSNPAARRLYLAHGFDTVASNAVSEQMIWRA